MKNNKDYNYKIFKSEACGHVVEYKMIKKENSLEKARVDEGKSDEQKRSDREGRDSGYWSKKDLGTSFGLHKPTEEGSGKNINYDIHSKNKPKAVEAIKFNSKMNKEEKDLGKARVDEGLSAKQKKKARYERNDPYGTKSGSWKPNIRGSKQEKNPAGQFYKEKLQDKYGKKPSREDLEYPMAASEEDCKCEDKAEKCECEDKEMKKREKFYIQKIQELRKQADPTAPVRQSISDTIGSAGSWLKSKFNNPKDPTAPVRQAVSNTAQNIGSGASNMLANRSSDARNQKAQNMGNPQEPAMSSNMAQKTPKPAVSNEAIQNVSQLTNPAGGMSNQNMSIGKQAAAPAPQATQAVTPQATQAVTPQTATAPAPQSFGEAFKAARAARMGGGGKDTFEFGGKKYHSFTKDDFAQGLGSNFNPNRTK